MSLLFDSEETFVTLCQSMSIDIRIQKAIMRLGHVRPTLVQSKCLPIAISSGRDLLVRARTGSGKTLAYCIPILQKILSSSPQQPQPSSSSFKTNHVCTSVRAVILVPTRELCAQIHQVLQQLIYYCSDKVTIAVLSVGTTVAGAATATKKNQNNNNNDEFERQEAMLRDQPDIIIATPNALLKHIRHDSTGDNSSAPTKNEKGKNQHLPHRPNRMTMTIDLKSSLEILVIDEADLILSFGYSNDLQEISTTALPRIYQGMLLSATLNPEMDQLKKILLHTPVIVKLEQDDDAARNTTGVSSSSGVLLKQFYIALPNKDKNLVLYVFIKLGLLKGKGLFFVNTTDAGYRLKLFFEQFHIRSAVLNAELPFRSRMNIIEQYNIGNFDYLIATDTSTDAVAVATTTAMNKNQNQSDDDDDENDDDDIDGDGNNDHRDVSVNTKPSTTPNKSKRIVDSGYGVSRGLDFRNVSFVVNVDLPPNPRSYAHRIGRTARGGAKGVALSLIDINSKEQLQILHDIQDSQPRIPIIGASTETLNAAPTSTNTTDDTLTTHNHFDQPQPVPLDFNLQEIEGFRYRVEDVSRAVTRSAVRETRAAELKAEILNSERLQAHFADNPTDLQILAHDRIATHVSKVQEHLKHVPKYLLPRGMQVANLTRRKKKRVNKRGHTGGERRSDNDPLQTFDGDVNMDGVHGSDDADNHDDPYAHFMKDDDAEDDGGGKNGIDTKKQKIDQTNNDKVFTNTKDGTGQSTAGRSAWKEKHKKGKFSSKKRLVDRKYKAPLGI